MSACNMKISNENVSVIEIESFTFIYWRYEWYEDTNHGGLKRIDTSSSKHELLQTLNSVLEGINQ